MMRRYKNDKSGKIMYSARNKTKIILSGYYNYLFNICRCHAAIPNEALIWGRRSPWQKVFQKYIITHTFTTQKRLYVGSGWEPEHRSRYLSTLLSHLVENPGMNPGTYRLFSSHLVENLDIDLCTSRHFLSHLVENAVPLVFLVTNMWSCRWTYKQQTQLLLNAMSFCRGNG